MKRCVHLIILLIIVVLFASCNSSNSFEGDWYDAYGADLYHFSDGEIFCEDHFIELDDGKKITGTYTECDGYIDTYIIGWSADELKSLYIIKEGESVFLCDSNDGTGNIYFYRNKADAEASTTEWNAQFEEVHEDVEKAESEPVETDYDSIIAGKHKNKTVIIEGIVSSYEYTEYGSYVFDLWFWSRERNEYIQDSLWSFDEEDKDMIDIVKRLTDGDKVRVTVGVYEDNSFGCSSIIGIELVEEGELSDYGIIVPKNDDSDNLSEESGSNNERYVYIANSGTKYHAETCRTLKKSKNKILYTEAVDRGYTPCDICNPT